ncbi:MAG: ATP synthase F0 subunit B [Betaproteobacteria bacterium]|nr:ATP synthase F0 subunit B [Betaproteobacteria bacterium]
MAELKLKPELLPMVIQGGFYLAALASAHFLLIKPLLGLTAERRKRTAGAVDSARDMEAKIEKLEKSYTTALASAVSEARDLRNAEILAGQAEAQSILSTANEQAKNKLSEAREKLTTQMADDRAKIPTLVGELSDAVLSKLTRAALLVGTAFGSIFFADAHAADGAVDPMYGILWPYFQFIVFVAALTFFARKPITKMLDGRRDALRTRLSEAREATLLAQRRTDEYEAKLKNLQTELDALRREYAEDGVLQRDKLITEAKNTASQIMRDSERVGQQLIFESRAELKREIFEQVLATLDQKLKGETLGKVDDALKKSALAGLKTSAQQTPTH